MSGEFVGTTQNVFMMQADDGTLEAAIEVILLCSTPIYVIKDGGVHKTDRIEELRFIANPDRIKTLIEHLTDMAEQAEVLKARIELKGGAE